MKFTKIFLQNLVWGDYDDEDLELIQDELVETSRWSEIHVIVFKIGDHYYDSSYSSGLTEYQDERPYEYDPDEIECREVMPVEKTITVYVKKE